MPVNGKKMIQHFLHWTSEVALFLTFHLHYW